MPVRSWLDAADVPRMCDLMRKYRVLPMDAALVRVAEREKIAPYQVRQVRTVILKYHLGGG